jgi:HEAT repeat protein
MWKIRRHGYLPSRIFGYALALFAFMRGEIEPAWARFLRLDAETPLTKGLRFLRDGGETLFHPDTVSLTRQPISVREAARRLSEGTAAIRLATLWEIVGAGLKDPALLPHIERCLSDRDRDLHAEAATTLSFFGPDAAPAVPALIRALGSAAQNVRVSSALALGAIAARPDIVVPALEELLIGQPDDVVQAAARALREFGRNAEGAAAPLLAALRMALIGCSDYLAEDLAVTLHLAVPDAILRARESFGADRELRGRAIALLKLAAEPLESHPESC